MPKNIHLMSIILPIDHYKIHLFLNTICYNILNLIYFCMQFDEEKLLAIEHTGSPLLVTAGPGSGKTRVITERIKFLLKTGLKPSEILCLTFSD